MRLFSQAAHPSLLVAVLGLFVWSLSACKTTQGGGSSIASAVDGSDGSFSGSAQAAAATLQAKYNPYEVQSFTTPPQDCRTLITPADPGVPFRGTAVLLHGFTACPQQYYEMSQILAKKGVQSFAPLLPGHGRAPQPLPAMGGKVGGVSFSDYYGEYLPKVEDNGWQAYGQFIDDVNSFVALLPGDHYVAGLSGGGLLATYAYVSQPNLYSTALIMDPYYGMPGSYLGQNQTSQGVLTPIEQGIGDGLYVIQKAVIDEATKTISLIAALPVSWGPGCVAQSVAAAGSIGRAGICDFRFDNLAAVDSFGSYLFSNYLAKLPATSSTHVQYIMREFDESADTLLTRKAQALQQQTWGQQVQICTYPNAIPHSFFARSDLSGIADPYWLNAFFKSGTNHLAFASPFPTDTSSQSQEVAYDPATSSNTNVFLSRCDTTEIAYPDVYDTPLVPATTP